MTVRENVRGADNQQERLPLSPDYVVGLIDGEGYFSVSASIDTSKNYVSRRVRVIFGVKIKEADGEILERLRYTLGCGDIFFRKDIRPKFSNCFEYQVRKYEDIRSIVIPFFKKYRLQMKSKRESFERFCEIAELFEQKLHLSERGFTRVRELARAVHR